jgi:hypothetical protein
MLESPFVRRSPKIVGPLLAAAAALLALLVCDAAPALAETVQAPTTGAPAAPKVCAGQEFSPVFESFKDPNLYTLVPGSQFNSPEEGWSFSGGAHIVTTARPNGQVGGVLEMPYGSQAISPQVCVTLLYNTARVWVRNLSSGAGLTVAVAYAGTDTANAPKVVGQVHSNHQEEWEPANPFNVQPQTAGPAEEEREVRFVFQANSGGGNTTWQIWGLYVDPRQV